MNITYSNRRYYLCEDHFKDKNFTNSLKNRLNKFTLPFINKINIIQNIQIVPSRAPLNILEHNLLNSEIINIDDTSKKECNEIFLIKKKLLD